LFQNKGRFNLATTAVWAAEVNLEMNSHAAPQPGINCAVPQTRLNLELDDIAVQLAGGDQVMDNIFVQLAGGDQVMDNWAVGTNMEKADTVVCLSRTNLEVDNTMVHLFRPNLEMDNTMVHWSRTNWRWTT
jgi:hypothetical protein